MKALKTWNENKATTKNVAESAKYIEKIPKVLKSRKERTNL